VTFLVDTNFLIGRWRRRDGPESRFIADHADDSLVMPWIVKGEFLRGASVAGHDASTVSAFLDEFPTVWPTEQTLVTYAQTYASLLLVKAAIGPHDLWIAACALEQDLPLITRNVREFERVLGLVVVDYASHRASP
jgi:tRNA(fMet)-specific endonuclease VapC